MAKESQEPTPYAVECPKHGIVYLTEEEYDRQMELLDTAWQCPRMESSPIGICGMASEFSDSIFEAAFLKRH